VRAELWGKSRVRLLTGVVACYSEQINVLVVTRNCLRQFYEIFRTTPEDFEIRGFTPETHQMFSVHTTPEKFENATDYYRQFWICG